MCTTVQLEVREKEEANLNIRDRSELYCIDTFNFVMIINAPLEELARSAYYLSRLTHRPRIYVCTYVYGGRGGGIRASAPAR